MPAEQDPVPGLRDDRLSGIGVLARERGFKRLDAYLRWTLYDEGERQRAEALLESMIDDEGPLPGNARATLAAIRAARGGQL